jgi:hypothetical protein
MCADLTVSGPVSPESNAVPSPGVRAGKATNGAPGSGTGDGVSGTLLADGR